MKAKTPWSRRIKFAMMANVLSNALFAYVLFNWLINKVDGGANDISPTVVSYDYQWNTVFLAVAVISFLLAKRANQKLAVTLVGINLLIAAYVLYTASSLF